MKNFKEVYELGTDAYTKHTKKMTPGQNEGYEGEVTKILSKKGIDAYFKNGKLMVSKRDKDAAMKALKKKSHKVDMPTIQVESEHVTRYGDHWKEAADVGYIDEKRKMMKKDPMDRLKRLTPTQRAALARADRTAKPKSQVSLAKMPEEVEYVEESTSFAGTQHVQLTRYSARGGLGLQITQTKTMPGMERRLTGAYVNIPMKDVPKLMKSLQRVFKADIKDPGDDL